MRVIEDRFGKLVRLTDERIEHILEHPEMSQLLPCVDETIRNPEIVRISRSDCMVRLHYAFLRETLFGSKWHCVVIKYQQQNAFVVTAT